MEAICIMCAFVQMGTRMFLPMKKFFPIFPQMSTREVNAYECVFSGIILIWQINVQKYQVTPSSTTGATTVDSLWPMVSSICAISQYIEKETNKNGNGKLLATND